jgi:hypothetical protein
MASRAHPATAFVAASLLVFAASPAHALLRTNTELEPAKAAAAVPVVRRATLRPEAQVRLDAPSPQELQQSIDARADASGRTQVGFARPVTALRTAGEVARRLAWARLDGDRQVAALAITSPGASALRVALRMGSVPRGTRLRFSDAAGVAAEVEAAQVEAAIARNVYYGDDGAGAHLYWSPVIPGETAVVEIEIPAGAGDADARLAIPLVSHLVTSAAQGFAAACAADACMDDLGPADRDALVRIVFTEDGATYACQGMLLADRDPATVIPYFLTAAHCVARQSAASSLQPFWPRGGRACAADARLVAGEMGATLLQADMANDLVLLRLLKSPPAGATYAGWVVGGASEANGSGATEAIGSGPTEANRSGASAANRSGGPAPVMPVAYAGDGAGSAAPPAPRGGACATPGATSARFEHAYNAGLYQWLGGMPQDGADNRSSDLAPGS